MNLTSINLSELNNNKEYPATFDRPHNLNVSLTYTARPRWLITSMLLFGCERKYSWDFQTDNGNRLVVDGILTNELKAQFIKLSLSNPYMNLSYRAYSGATVKVHDGKDLYIFTEPKDEPGSYYSIPFQAKINKTCELTVVADSIYSATDHMVAITSLEAFQIQKNDTNNLYRYNYTEEQDPAMMEVYYDWSTVPAYCEKYGNCKATEIFYTIKTIDVNRSFAPDKQIIWFPQGTVIVRKKYSLSQEYHDLLRSLLMELQWSIGIFWRMYGTNRYNTDKY